MITLKILFIFQQTISRFRNRLSDLKLSETKLQRLDKKVQGMSLRHSRISQFYIAHIRSCFIELWKCNGTVRKSSLQNQKPSKADL